MSQNVIAITRPDGVDVYAGPDLDIVLTLADAEVYEDVVANAKKSWWSQELSYQASIGKIPDSGYKISVAEVKITLVKELV